MTSPATRIFIRVLNNFIPLYEPSFFDYTPTGYQESDSKVYETETISGKNDAGSENISFDNAIVGQGNYWINKDKVIYLRVLAVSAMKYYGKEYLPIDSILV